MNRFETIDQLLQATAKAHAISNIPGEVTCGKAPFHLALFVESDDPRIGIFAAPFAAHLLNNFVQSVPGEDDRQFLLKVAGLIHDHPETQSEIAQLTGDLNESVANINSAIQTLAQADRDDSLPGY